ncbi:lef7 [Cyclophragma undans nucleopolyhedrovirus]|uniref:Lef7 n=1 Tax=Cyclophragma undans nucleopolyhedrovirus TaxID=1906244 RepID=A0A288QPR4_9ABAC|nr:lef7 [Cyclophragma undans nucleopolyhedrovirus]AOT85497.1 lef7 [Cyclophragma undans nucleopolyhedrovirus]
MAESRMSSESRCGACWQTLPPTPQLPFEIVNKILDHLPAEHYIKIMGPDSHGGRRRLLKSGHVQKYLQLASFNYHPSTDAVMAAHCGVAANHPMARYVATLCAYEDARAARSFFNACIPAQVKADALSNPGHRLDAVLSERWPWWRLARNVLNHERRMGRELRPLEIDIIHRRDTPPRLLYKKYSENLQAFISEDIADLNACDECKAPLDVVYVRFDHNTIPLLLFNNCSNVFRDLHTIINE